MMMISFNPTVQNGQVVMQRNYNASGSNPNDAKADSTENKVSLTEGKQEVEASQKESTTTATSAVQNSTSARQGLMGGLENIQKMTNTGGLMGGSNAAALVAFNAIPTSSIGNMGLGKATSLPGAGALMGLLSGGKDAQKLLGNFANLASTLTGKSLGDVGKVMNVAQNLFKGGQLNLASAAGFIAKALGLNEKAVGLIATAASLMSNPFTIGAAMALVQQAIGLIGESKSNQNQANAKKTEASNQQQQANQKVELGEQITNATTQEQQSIQTLMQKIKDGQALNEEDIQKLLKAMKEAGRLQQANQNQQGGQKAIPNEQNKTPQNVPNNLGQLLNPPIATNTSYAIPPVATNISMPVSPVASSMRTPSFSPPSFSGGLTA